jgi:hypothetical protein
MPDEAPVLARDVDKKVNRPQFGPGSKVNWDNEDSDPNKRKHVGIDPQGKANLKESGLK